MAFRYPLRRRSFLSGLSVGTAALVAPFLEREARADAGVEGPQRLVVMQTPDGRPAELWRPSATGSTFTFGPTMKPFDSLKSDLVVIQGLEHRAGSGEPHCQAFVQWMTGMAGTTTANYTIANGPSVDQIVAANPTFVGSTPFKSLQLAGDMTALSVDISHRYMSWAGKNKPLPSEHRPLKNYAFIFEKLISSATSQAELARLIKRRRSVLDFVLKNDGRRFADRVPAGQKEYFEAHLEAIRSLEARLSALSTQPPGTEQCVLPNTSAYPANTANSSQKLPAFWAANMEILRLTLACDLSRVVTFIAAPTTSYLYHRSWVPSMTSPRAHHELTHDNNTQQLGLVMTWYTERIAAFVSSLKATPDGTRNLLGNTLVLYGSEFGSNGTHSTTNIPFVLFGNAGGRLRTGRSLSYLSSPRSSNDLWLSVFQLLQMPRATVGDPAKCGGPLPGLVA